MVSGNAAGIAISEDTALRWITANPAWVMGIDDVTGTLEVGKRADVVVWNAHPFSVYALPEVVIAGGEVAYERTAGRAPTDFEMGNSATEKPTAPAAPVTTGAGR
jgi:imidazolonepropionase-like amidohydrolase